MDRRFLNLRTILFFLAVAFAASCSRLPQNSNAPAPGSNQPAPSQSPSGTANIGAPPAAPAEAPAAPVAAAVSGNVTDKAADPTKAPASARAPKLAVPVKRIDFGKQPKGKTLVRTFVVKNTGLSALKIESVEPS